MLPHASTATPENLQFKWMRKGKKVVLKLELPGTTNGTLKAIAKVLNEHHREFSYFTGAGYKQGALHITTTLRSRADRKTLKQSAGRLIGQMTPTINWAIAAHQQCSTEGTPLHKSQIPQRRGKQPAYKPRYTPGLA